MLEHSCIYSAINGKIYIIFFIFPVDKVIQSARVFEMKPLKNIIGRQYGYRSSALRAIHRFQVRYFASIPKGFQFWVNRIDEGCHEIEGQKF